LATLPQPVRDSPYRLLPLLQTWPVRPAQTTILNPAPATESKRELLDSLYILILNESELAVGRRPSFHVTTTDQSCACNALPHKSSRREIVGKLNVQIHLCDIGASASAKKPLIIPCHPTVKAVDTPAPGLLSARSQRNSPRAVGTSLHDRRCPPAGRSHRSACNGWLLLLLAVAWSSVLRFSSFRFGCFCLRPAHTLWTHNQTMLIVTKSLRPALLAPLAGVWVPARRSGLPEDAVHAASKRVSSAGLHSEACDPPPVPVDEAILWQGRGVRTPVVRRFSVESTSDPPRDARICTKCRKMISWADPPHTPRTGHPFVAGG